METGSPSGTVTSEPVTRRLVGIMSKTGHSTDGDHQDSDKQVAPYSGEDVQTKMPHRSPKPGGAPFSSIDELGIKDSECYQWERKEYNSERSISESEVDVTGGEQDRTRTDDPAEQSMDGAASGPLPPPDGNMDEGLPTVPVDEENAALLYTCPSAEMTQESVSEPERSMGGDSGPDPPPTKSPPLFEHKRAGKDPSDDLAQDSAVPSFSMGNELQYPTLPVGGGRVSISTAGYSGDELWM